VLLALCDSVNKVRESNLSGEEYFSAAALQRSSLLCTATFRSAVRVERETIVGPFGSLLLRPLTMTGWPPVLGLPRSNTTLSATNLKVQRTRLFGSNPGGSAFRSNCRTISFLGSCCCTHRSPSGLGDGDVSIANMVVVHCCTACARTSRARPRDSSKA